MLKVFICEDETPLRETYEDYIENQLVIKELDAHLVLSTGEPKKILDYLLNHPDTTGIYFLDIELNAEMDGLSLAREIRNYDVLGKIIFLTTHDELAPITFQYKVEALDYIIKGELEKVKTSITECLDTIFAQQKVQPEKRKQFIIKNGKHERYIDHQDMLFFQTSTVPHMLYLHTLTGRIQFYGTVKDLISIGDNFVRVHKSVVANMDNVRSIDKEKLKLLFVNGQKCAFSKKKIKLVRDYLDQKKET
ncbi:accessory gene regulator protein A [Enterococcus florum]|uniref:Accessory gene regulator protein A n=1 Tax=Enterococcus florum TaxID=2480627 RepID=A0A4P5PIN1_9ENTE|nr:LytTR family DNA-binding domain-containing protein [Enterococcus florum]GCF93223.1 accessory gene regulator protein A [Enterococcus florum]